MKNKLMKKGDCIIRVLDEKENKVFIIDCIKKTMPCWCDKSFISDYEICSEDELGFDSREWKNNEITAKKAMELLNMKKSTFYSLLKSESKRSEV